MTGRNLYLSGPMTGYPEFNYPLFHAKAASLREQGWGVFNPAEWPYEEVGVKGSFAKYSAVICSEDCHAIYLLPGWRNSTGAMAEYHLAKAVGLEIIEDGKVAVASKHETVLTMWQEGKTAREIASSLGMTNGAVCQIVVRARDKGDERAKPRRPSSNPLTNREKNIILNLWKDGETPKYIAAMISRSTPTIGSAVVNARKAGDPRAVYRRKGRK